MHIHGAPPSMYADNLYAVANDPRTVAARRAAETRKKLSNAAHTLEGESTFEEALLVAQWMNPQPTPARAADEYQLNYTGRNSDLD